MQKWGFKSGCPWKRQIALIMALRRTLLARFSDLVVLQVRGIVFLKGGAFLCVAHRKNSRHGKYTRLLLADSGGEYSTTKLLRLHLAGDHRGPHPPGDHREPGGAVSTQTATHKGTQAH